jgi:hypothetical protein
MGWIFIKKGDCQSCWPSCLRWKVLNGYDYIMPIQHSFQWKLLMLIRDNPKVCHYLDMPLQHASNRVLTEMRRNITREDTIAN